MLNSNDNFYREALAIEADFSLPSARATRVLDQVIDWASRHGIELDYIQPGNPQQNTYAERYNRTVRHDWLNQHLWIASSNCKTSPPNGYRFTITNDPIWHWAASL